MSDHQTANDNYIATDPNADLVKLVRYERSEHHEPNILMPNTGLYLAEVRKAFHDLRTPYLTWAEKYRQPAGVALAHYRRSLIGLYEARKHATDPYTGELYHYVQSAADVYFSGNHHEIVAATDNQPLLEGTVGGHQNPLNHLPRPIYLGDVQQVMLQQFHEMGGSCQEVLLLTDYHDINPQKVAELLDYGTNIVALEDQRRKCLLMVRERWQSSGIMDAMLAPSPADEELIDRYYQGTLTNTERWEVEARRPGDAVFRTAMELREDWADVLAVAGRQDMMETLEREEARYASPTGGQGASAPASAQKDVKLTPRNRRGKIGNIQLPSISVVLAFVLFCVLGFLAYDTFDTTSPDRSYEAFYEPFPNLYRNNPPINEDERDLNNILVNYYDRGFYQRAYDELLPTAQAYPAAPLYLGVAAMELDNPGRAQQWFAQIERSSPYGPAADWYEALAFLAQRRKPAAITILSEIVADSSHPYRVRAEELLEELV